MYHFLDKNYDIHLNSLFQSFYALFLHACKLNESVISSQFKLLKNSSFSGYDVSLNFCQSSM